MRVFVFLCFCVFVFAEVQEAQIIQTYIYQPQAGDFTQEVQGKEVNLVVKSKELLQFLTSNLPKDNLEKQVVRFNNAYTEFKSKAQTIHTYANFLNERLRFNLSYMIYELEYIGNASYTIKNALQPIAKPQNCRFLIQKTLTSLLDARKDFVINLDNQTHFSKVLATYRFLQCSK